MYARTLVTLPVALALLACGGKRDDAKPAAAGSGSGAAPVAKAKAADDPFTLRDLSATALVRVEDTVPGVPFAIEIPAGLVRDAKDAYVNWTWPDGMFNAPSITVMILDLPPAGLEGAVAAARTTSDPALTVATQTVVPDGFLVSVHTPDDRFLSTELTRTIAGKAVRCSVVQRATAKQGPIPARAATTALAEKICQSLVAR